MRSVDIPAYSLKLEVTESAIMSDMEKLTPILHDLRSLGLHLCIDDFGTGQSQSGEKIDLDKAWDGLWYLLSAERRRTDDLYEPADILGQAIDGTVAFDNLSDPDADARYTSSSDVRRIAHAISSRNTEDLRKQFNPIAMQSAQVYPGDWEVIGGHGHFVEKMKF